MEEEAAEERRERLFSQWEMTNAICPERSACVNPRREPAGPHPTRRPLHPPPIPQLCQLLLDGQIRHGGAARARLRAHAGAAKPQVALRRPGAGLQRLLLRLFVSCFFCSELIICSSRLCCFSSALYPFAENAELRLQERRENNGPEQLSFGKPSVASNPQLQPGRSP